MENLARLAIPALLVGAVLAAGIAMAHSGLLGQGPAVDGDAAQGTVQEGFGMGMHMGGMMSGGMGAMAEMHEEMERLHERFEKGEITREEFIDAMAREMAENWDSMPCHAR